MFTASRAKMGALVAPWRLARVAVMVAAIVIALSLKLLWDVVTGGF